MPRIEKNAKFLSQTNPQLINSDTLQISSPSLTRTAFYFPKSSTENNTLAYWISSINNQTHELNRDNDITAKCTVSIDFLHQTLEKAIKEKNSSLIQRLLLDNSIYFHYPTSLIQKLISQKMTFTVINAGIILGRKGRLSSSDILMLLLFLLGGGNEKMTEMLRCLPATDPAFLEIQFPEGSSGIAIGILLESILSHLPPDEDLKMVFKCQASSISNSFLLLLFTELLELKKHSNIIYVISLLFDIFFTRLCILDEFVPLLIQLKDFLTSELRIINQGIFISNLIDAVDESKMTPKFNLPNIRKLKPHYSCEQFEWRLMARMLAPLN